MEENIEYLGHISEVEKYYFYAIFKRHLQEDLQLKVKIKKLTDKQQSLLIKGRIMKINLTESKVYFLADIKKQIWI